MRGAYGSPRGSSPRLSVHPHVRGAYIVLMAGMATGFGSSPRAWGLRRCGFDWCRLVHGSSPRAWGLRYGRTKEHKAIRFIPTCVGLTFATPLPATGFRRFIPTCVGLTILQRFIWSLPPVHPHVRGAYCRFYFDYSVFAGSSPRAWGLRYGCPYRFTSDSVHPHVRGAYQSD